MDISGVLLVDKPMDITSFGVVRKVKKWLKVKKIGHGGTLDPLATGVLPIFINKATKIAQFFLNMDKAYVATMYLGLETDTQDIEGEVVKVYEKVDISIEELQGVMNSFKGRITQVPPLYSAIKVNRVPLYKWVRKGIKKKCPQREIEIYELELTSFNPPKVEFSISCSKGTYVRTLCAEIGKKLGCGACLIALRRLKTGPFSVKRAISLNTLKEAIRGEIWQNYLMDLNEALIDFMAITLNDNQETQIKQGRFILWTEKLTNTLIRGLNKKGQLIALLKPHEEKGGIQLRPVRVF